MAYDITFGIIKLSEQTPLPAGDIIKYQEEAITSSEFELILSAKAAASWWKAATIKTKNSGYFINLAQIVTLDKCNGTYVFRVPNASLTDSYFYLGKANLFGSRIDEVYRIVDLSYAAGKRITLTWEWANANFTVPSS